MHTFQSNSAEEKTESMVPHDALIGFSSVDAAMDAKCDGHLFPAVDLVLAAHARIDVKPEAPQHLNHIHLGRSDGHVLRVG
eukprot:360341-Chlamydomonas_euryale.AAC.4